MSRSAVAIGVCDLLAARKLTQLTSHQSHFYCSVCGCTHQSTLGRTDTENWIHREVATLRQHAEAWKDAASQSEQTRITKAQGLRWSELWRLPYWDPTCQLVVDPMHCLFEGLIHNHVRRVLRLTENAKSGPTPPAFTHDFTNYDPENQQWALKEHEIEQVTQIHALLTKSLTNEIEADSDSDAMSIDVTNAGSTVASTTANMPFNYDWLRKGLLRNNLGPLKFVHDDIFAAQRQSSHLFSKAVLTNKLIQWVSPNTYMEA
jgi:hypothetical protein